MSNQFATVMMDLVQKRSEVAALGAALLEAQTELTRLRAENVAMRGLLRSGMHHAEWSDKTIYPYKGENYKNWTLKVYLPVPVSEQDDSVESALERAIDAARAALKEQP
jgi:hypothetical protein